MADICVRFEFEGTDSGFEMGAYGSVAEAAKAVLRNRPPVASGGVVCVFVDIGEDLEERELARVEMGRVRQLAEGAS